MYDFAKSVTNLGMWLAGSDTPPLQAWDNMLDRYGMSFVGGMLGGAMFDALPNLRAARQLGSMDSKQAMFAATPKLLPALLREIDPAINTAL